MPEVYGFESFGSEEACGSLLPQCSLADSELCKKYGWDPEKAVWTHYEITTRGMSKTDCVDPQHIRDGLGMGYDMKDL